MSARSGRRAGRSGAAALATAAALGLAASLAACGSGGSTLRISAASSLEKAFTQYASQFGRAKVSYSFAGSDALAAQIEQGARPDVFASANTKLPNELYTRGRVERPVVFTSNTLVLAVPAGSPLHSLAGVERRGRTVAVGTASVPVGAYTQKVLARLPAPGRRVLEANIKDREPDVAGIVGKLVEGAADAGFVYATDVRATDGKLRAILLPAPLQPRVAYAIAVVRGTSHRADARSFIAGLLSGAGREDLHRDGFLPPPG